MYYILVGLIFSIKYWTVYGKLINKLLFLIIHLKSNFSNVIWGNLLNYTLDKNVYYYDLFILIHWRNDLFLFLKNIWFMNLHNYRTEENNMKIK